MRAIATLVLANSFLLFPVWVLNRGFKPHLLALETAILTAAFLLFPSGRLTRVAARLSALLVVTISVLQLGDTTARMSLARPLNLYLDLQLVSSVVNLLHGTLGELVGTIAVASGILLYALVAILLGSLLGTLHPETGNRQQKMVSALLLILALVAVPLRWMHPHGVVLGLPAVQLTRDQVKHVSSMILENERFAREMEHVPGQYEETHGLLEGLEGRDLIMAFIESYGISAIEDERYAPVIRPRLESMDAALEEAGIHVVTGKLIAPSQGGMSWLGHGSILSGLWLENQLRYDLLLASDRQTLVDDFKAAGYRTTAIVPAITMAWPEGDRFGYDQIYAFHDIKYEGPSLNWVTMPDQFTWSYLEQTVRKESSRPLFAEISLISSHAPWTPILPVIEDWSAIGNGEIFDPFGDAGEAPEDLWRDGDRVREHYALAVGYAIDAMASYAERYLNAQTVLIALGDHQAAPLITGQDASRAVPVHVIARDLEVLTPFLDWGFLPGVLPPSTEEVRQMDAFRNWFVNAYSGTKEESPSP